MPVFSFVTWTIPLSSGFIVLRHTSIPILPFHSLLETSNQDVYMSSLSLLSATHNTIPLQHYIIYNLHTSSTPRFLRRSLCGRESDGELWGTGLWSPPPPELSQSAAGILLSLHLISISLVPLLTHNPLPCHYHHSFFFHPPFLSLSSLLFIPRYIIWSDSEYFSLSFSLRLLLTSVHYLYRCPFIFLLQTFIFSSYTYLIRMRFVF